MKTWHQFSINSMPLEWGILDYNGRPMKPILQRLPKMLSTIRRRNKGWKKPIVGDFAVGPQAEYQVLFSTLLSLRTQDKTTESAARRLFEAAPSPDRLAAMKADAVEKLIYPVGFYRTKARTIIRVAQILIEQYGGRVPDTLEQLLALPGVGRKTANLTLTVGYGKPGICVDTHVHRISNRWGLVKTGTPDETEMALREILPKKYWMHFNDLLVCYGQNCCVPTSPFCSRCPLAADCPKIGVKRHR